MEEQECEILSVEVVSEETEVLASWDKQHDDEEGKHAPVNVAEEVEVDLQGHCVAYNPPHRLRDKIGGKIQNGGGKIKKGGKVQNGGKMQDGVPIQDGDQIGEGEQITDSSPSTTVEETTKIIDLQSEHSYPLIKEKLTEGMKMCPICNRYISEMRMQAHITNQHQKSSKSYKCAYCDCRSIYENVIEAHIKKYHPGQQVVIYYLPYEEGDTSDKPVKIASPATVHSPKSTSILKSQGSRIVKKSPMQPISKFPCTAKNQESAFGMLRRPTHSVRIRNHSVKIIRASELDKMVEKLVVCPVCRNLFSPQRIAQHIQRMHKNTNSTRQQSSPASADSSPAPVQEAEKEQQQQEQKKEEDWERTVCKAKLGGQHKMCGKCGAIYFKLRKHKLYCKDIMKNKPNE